MQVFLIDTILQNKQISFLEKLQIKIAGCNGSVVQRRNACRPSPMSLYLPQNSQKGGI